MALSKVTVDDIPFERELVTIDSKATIVDAFTTLVRHHVLSAPVLDSVTNKYIGFFDISDFSEYVVHILEHSVSQQDELVPIEFCDLYDLLMTVGELHPQVLLSVMHTVNGEKFPSVPTGTPMATVLDCLGNKGLHRVAVVDLKTGSVVKIISQSAVMKFLVAHPEALACLQAPTVASSGIGLKHVVAVAAEAPVLDGLKLLQQHHLSGLAVVDAEGTLVTTMSSSDLRTAVSGERFRFAGISVLEFVQRSRELDGKQEKPAVVTVSAETSLLDVFRKLAKTGLHRIYVVDAAHKPVGVVSLKDLLRYVTHHTKL